MEIKELEPKTEPEEIEETEKALVEPDRKSSLGWKGLVGIPIAAYLGLSFCHRYIDGIPFDGHGRRSFPSDESFTVAPKRPDCDYFLLVQIFDTLQ